MIIVISKCFNFVIDRRIEKESLKDYIEKKREMFLVQVSDREIQIND